MVRVGGVEIGVVGLQFDPQRILEADLFEGLVPFEDAGLDRLTIFFRDVAVEPVDDRLFRLGQRGLRILFFQAPALDVIDLGEGRDIVGEVPATRDEMADAIVGRPGVHRLGKLGHAVVIAEEETARVLEVGRGRHTRGRGTGRARRQLRHRVMRRHAETGQVGAVVDAGETRVARVERVPDAIRRLERAGPRREIAQQQRIELDQHGFAFRMGLAGHRYRAQQAVAGRLAHCARQRRAGKRDELAVLGDQLHQIAQPVEFDDVRAQHRAGERFALADALRAVQLQEERMIDLLRLDLQPDLLVLVVDVEKAWLLLGILDDFGERLLLCRDGGDRRGSRRCRDGWRAASLGVAGLGGRATGPGGDRRRVFGRGLCRPGRGDRRSGHRGGIAGGDGGAAAGQQRGGGNGHGELRESGEGCGHGAFS